MPFLNLVRPKQIVDDIYRVGSYDVPTWGWQERVVDPIVHWWWLTYVVGVIGLRVSLDAPVESTGRAFRCTAALILVALSACLAMVVVKRLSERQERQQELLRVEVTATGEKPPYGRWLTFVMLGVIGISAIVAVFRIEPSNDEARSELMAEVVDGGMSDSEARCYVDALDARFDLARDIPGDIAAVRFAVTKELECVGASSEMSDCYITSIVDHLGDDSGARDVADALASEKGHRFLFEAGGRCAGLSSDQVECIRTELLDEYPDAFKQLGLNAEQSSYIAAQTQCL